MLAFVLAGLAACTFPDPPMIDGGEGVDAEVDGPDIDAGPMARLTIERSGSAADLGAVTSAPQGIDCGSVCSRDFPLGATVQLERSLQPGAIFTGWDGDCTGTEPTCTVVLDAPRTVGAEFLIAQHTITISPGGNGTGAVTSEPAGLGCPGGTCALLLDHGTQLTLTATPTGVSTFAGWNDVSCSGTGTCSFTVTQDETIDAAFALDFTLVVNKDGNGRGRVTSNLAGIDCGADCDQVYPAGTMVILSAAADPDSTFTGWSGACTGTTGTCTVTIDDVVAVTANFALRRYTLTASRTGSGSGTIASDPDGIDCGTDCTETYDHGTQVTLSATAGATSTFTGWSDAGCPGTAACVVTMTAARSVSAQFTVNRYPLVVNRTGNGAALGSVISGPMGITCGTDCDELFDAGAMVTLSASAASGATFAGWSGGGCTGTGSCTVTVAAATTVDANFTLNGYTVSVTRSGTGAALGTVTSSPGTINCGTACSDAFTFNTSVTLAATAAAGATFTGWSGGGCTGSTGSCVVVVSGDTALTANFTLDSYTLAVVRAGNAGSAGSVTSAPSGITCTPGMNDCDQSYPFNTMVTLTAAPGAGSTFGGWSGGGCAGTGTCVVTMNAAKTVTATFTLNEALTVTRGGNGAGLGTVTSSPTGISCGGDCSENFGIGTMVTLTASTMTGASFVGWSGACSGTAATCVVTVAAASNATATFTLVQHTLTAARAGDGSGSIDANPGGITCGADCTQAYDHGTLVELTATPDAGATFTGWSGGGCTGTGPCLVTMTAATTVTATFQADRTLTVATAGNGSGNVTSTPGGITCPGDCTEVYSHGTSVTLTATPATGSTFTGWSGGGCSGTGTCVVNLNGARSVQASFALTTHTLTVARTGTGMALGSVSSAPVGILCGGDCTEAVTYGTTMTLTATAAAGASFTGWSGGGCAGTSPCAVIVTAATTVSANFEADQILTVTRAGGGSTYGLVTSNPAGINCGADCTQAYTHGTPVTITAASTPPEAATFDGWSNTATCNGTTSPCTLSMTAARSATATFTKRPYTLTAARGGNGSGTVTSTPGGITCGASCSMTVDYGTMVTLTAAPATGSSFTGWSGGGCSGAGTCVTTVTAAATVTATFTLTQHVLTVDKAGDGGGTVSSNPIGIGCGGDCTEAYNYNTSVLLTATPVAGSTFTGWAGGGCSGNGNCTTTITAATTVIATFQLDRTLTVSVGGTGSGTVSSNPAGIGCPGDCTQVYDHGTQVTLTAAPAAGSTFSTWGGACSGNGACVVALDQARTVTASFALTIHTLEVMRTGTAAATGNVTSMPAGISCGSDCNEPVTYGTVITLSAVAGAGSTFTGWSGGGCSGNGQCVTTVTAATTITAGFAAHQPLSITMNGTGSAYGRVTSVPTGISCGGDCNESYPINTSVTLTASSVPATAATFSGWMGGGCSGTAPCTVLMDQVRNVTATFAVNNHTLDVMRNGNGTVSSTPGGITCGTDCAEAYVHGTMVSLSASPAAGSTFTGWGGVCSGSGSCAVTLDATKTVIANFALIPYTVTAVRTTDGAVSGTITSAPAGITCPGDCTESYNHGTSVTFTAAPAAGASFAGWTTGGCAGTGDCTITVGGATTVTADFKVHKTLSVLVSGTGSGGVTSMPAGINTPATTSASFAHGTLVTLMATPNSTTSTFGGWSGGGCSGTLMTCSVPMDQTQNVTATFTLRSYTLSVVKAGFGSGTVTSSPAGTIACGADCSEPVNHGGSITLVATPAAGDLFFGWSGGGCSGTGTCTTTVTAATTVTATFDQCNRAVAESCTDATGFYEACTTTGQSTSTMTCPLGCSPTVEKCLDVNPSNGLASYLAMTATAPPVTLAGAWTIDTTNGIITNGNQLSVPTATVGGMRVFMVSSLTISGTAKVTGNLPLAFVSNGDVLLTGTLDVSADMALRGPGESVGACNGAPGDYNPPSSGAGGGGGFYAGSNGGNAGNGNPGGAGGAQLGVAALIPLNGGCAGGMSQELNGSLFDQAPGGGGGGAVQIVSRTKITMQGGGKLDASGGGGTSIVTQGGTRMAGSGGGSGGSILFEAPIVIVDGAGTALAAKGGSGAAVGTGLAAHSGKDGVHQGVYNNTPQPGGTNVGFPSGGDGGTAAINSNTGGGWGTSSSMDGGGGGGSVGRLRVNNTSGAFSPVNGGAVYAASSIGTLGTRLVP